MQLMVFVCVKSGIKFIIIIINLEWKGGLWYQKEYWSQYSMEIEEILAFTLQVILHSCRLRSFTQKTNFVSRNHFL
jgi:hypothetical protein